MPIYAYRCSACGHTKDVLQKLSDPLLTDCPACGAPALAKQITAAGFQLKGSGWYATDFKGNGAPKPATDGDAPVADAKPAPDTGTPASTGPGPAPAAAASAVPASAPAATSGSDGARGA